MWIRSQDKKQLIKATQLDVNLQGRICAEGYTENGCFMGEYESQERAIEVLDDIFSKIIQGFTTYQMPIK